MAPKTKSPLSPSVQLAHQIAQVALAKKATDVRVLDLRDPVYGGFTDFFVICSGSVAQHVKAIVDAIDEQLRPANRPWHIEGYQNLTWVLMDYVDVVVHVFQPETRTYYNLERLWADAPVEIFEDDRA